MGGELLHNTNTALNSPTVEALGGTVGEALIIRAGELSSLPKMVRAPAAIRSRWRKSSGCTT